MMTEAEPSAEASIDTPQDPKNVKAFVFQNVNLITMVNDQVLENLEEEMALVAASNVWNTPSLAIVNVMKAEDELTAWNSFLPEP